MILRLKKVFEQIKNSNCFSIFVTGDFNEPSILDWTEKQVANNMVPFVVEWPVSKLLQELGFKDSYRIIYSDESVYPGLTWFAPVAEWEFQGMRKDRIDFIYYMNSIIENIEVVETTLSDHKAVIGTYRFMENNCLLRKEP